MEIIKTIFIILLPFLLNARIFGNGNKVIAQKFNLNIKLSFWLGVVLGGIGMIIIYFQARVFTFKKFLLGLSRLFIGAILFQIFAEFGFYEYNGLAHSLLLAYVVFPYALRGKNIYKGVLNDF